MYVFDEIDTHKEWHRLCTIWGKPAKPPATSISSLSKVELVNRVVCVYRKNSDLAERDFALIRPPGASTPVKGTFFWVQGANSIL